MSESPLVCYTKISPHKSSPRNHAIDTITIHCMAGNATVESCGETFQTKEASSNYGIGSDGRIAQYVSEHDRSWCTSSRSNDNRAITIEVANNGGAPDWPVSNEAYEALIYLVADICKRNGIKKLRWEANCQLIGQIDRQNMTVHRWFENKACPGNYLYNRHGDIARRVNEILDQMEVDEMDFTQLTDAQVEQLLNRFSVYLSKKSASDYAKVSAKKAIDSGLFADGDGDGLLDNPQGFVTREQLAVVLNRNGDLDKK
jgi:N-acetyl-anhydromuramyl-L-alanine amidase AmpD